MRVLKKKRAFLFGVSLAFLALVPVSEAAIVPQCGADCTFCDLIQLGKNIVDFIVVDISTPLAAVIFAYAGFLYITAAGNQGQLEKAKGIFTKVAFGFIIILSSWLLVDTIMKTLTGSPLGVWLPVSCESAVTSTAPQFFGSGAGHGAGNFGTGFSPAPAVSTPPATTAPPPLPAPPSVIPRSNIDTTIPSGTFTPLEPVTAPPAPTTKYNYDDTPSFHIEITVPVPPSTPSTPSLPANSGYTPPEPVPGNVAPATHSYTPPIP